MLYSQKFSVPFGRCLSFLFAYIVPLDLLDFDHWLCPVLLSVEEKNQMWNCKYTWTQFMNSSIFCRIRGHRIRCCVAFQFPAIGENISLVKLVFFSCISFVHRFDNIFFLQQKLCFRFVSFGSVSFDVLVSGSERFFGGFTASIECKNKTKGHICLPFPLTTFGGN